jgi:signal peptidase II
LKRVLITVLIVLFVDQLIKFWIKTHYQIGEETPLLGDWFKLHFTENPGMAFGWILPFDNPNTSKIFLSVFRIFAVGGIGYYLHLLVKREAPKGLIISISLIFAGALGNILDSAFFGLLFGPSSQFAVAEFMPDGGGYTGFLQGKVVDMFRFDINLYWSGKAHSIFPPVFNAADSAITAGVALIIINQKKYFAAVEDDPPTDENAVEGGEVVPENQTEAPAAESEIPPVAETPPEEVNKTDDAPDDPSNDTSAEENVPDLPPS